MQDNDKCEGHIHELWLIYDQLKDAETDPAVRNQLISSARARLGQVVNALNGFRLEPKQPCSQAANLNCRYRQKDLTPDKVFPSALHEVHVGLKEARVQALLELLPR